MSGGGAPEALALALSPLLSPLRFLSRTGLERVAALRDIEPLVQRVVEQARPYAGDRAEGLDRLEETARGFDSATEASRRTAIVALVRELSCLLDVPAEIAALGRSDGPSLPSPSPPTATPPSTSTAPSRRAAIAAAPQKAGLTPDPLLTPVDRLRGVGPALHEKLRSKGLATVQDVLLNLPRRYEDRRKRRTVAEAPLGERSVIAGTVAWVDEVRARRGRRLEVRLRDEEGGYLMLLWFHYRPSLVQRLRTGARIVVSGDVRAGYRGGAKTMSHPDVEPLEAGGDGELPLDPGSDDSFGRVVPVYTDVEGVPARTYRRIARRAVDEYAAHLADVLPHGVLERRKLWPLAEAVREAHFPDRSAEVAATAQRPAGEPHRRMAFEELFMVQLGLALRRRGVKVEPGIAFRATDASIQRIVGSLPWPLTGAQRRAVQGIAQDMRKPEPMNRLLQGDVGSGKTAVALCAALLAVEDGYQVALMAPTEILAEQHTRSLRRLLRERREVHVGLVTGSLGARERAHAERLVRGGAAHIVVGTHALAEEETGFHKLGLAVIDAAPTCW